jgi:hypothetical protein
MSDQVDVIGGGVKLGGKYTNPGVQDDYRQYWQDKADA